MNKLICNKIFRDIKIVALILLLSLFFVKAACAIKQTPDQQVNIGVLAKRGIATTIKKWQPTADYLNNAIPGYHFSIQPLSFDAIKVSVEQQKIDFILSNPYFYVELETRYGVQRLVTLKNRLGASIETQFGGVIFTRSDNEKIQSMGDLQDKKLIAVDKQSLGGFLMAWGEMDKLGLNPFEDFFSLEFVRTHDAVVYNIHNGQGDVGLVRTEVLERMANEGKINLSDFRVINQQKDTKKSGFKFLRSTPLYPEWPFAKLASTSEELTRKVTVALLNMSKDSPAAVAAKSAGWDVAHNYHEVHQLLKTLKVGIYKNEGKINVKEVIQQYWPWILLALLVLLVMILVTSYVMKLNVSLQQSRLALQKSNFELDEKVTERTQKLINVSQERELLLESVAEGIYGIDINGDAIFINSAAQHLLGFSADEVIGHSNHHLFHHTKADGQPYPEEECKIKLSMEKRMVMRIKDDFFWHKEGYSFPVEYVSAPLIRDDKVIGAVVVFTDITERKKFEAELEYLGNHDPLTGLPNRRQLIMDFEHESKRALRYDRKMALFYMDLNKFKKINDDLGHEVGDKLLQFITKKLSEILRENETIYRVGGDEFCMLVPEFNSDDELIKLAERTVTDITAINQFGGMEIDIGCSIGIGIFPDNGATLSTLTASADEAMYLIKSSDKGNYCFVEN